MTKNQLDKIIIPETVITNIKQENTNPKTRMINHKIDIPFIKTFQTVLDPPKRNKFDNQNSPFRGGCLREFAHQWQQQGANHNILKLITGGRIPFLRKPPLQYPDSHVLRKYTTKKSKEMTNIISQLKQQKILETPPIINPGFLCHMFLVNKSDGGIRPIFDLRRLNLFVATKHFQLISQVDIRNFLQMNDWSVKIDIHQAYFHLPIAETHRRFLRIFYNNELLQLTALPFGLSSAPKMFATVSNWIAEILRARGFRILVYLDDFLLVNQDQQTLVSQVAETLSLLKTLGWHVNYNKSILEPSHEVEYLGLIWNTQENKIKLPGKKAMKIKLIISKLLKFKNSSLREMQSLLGLLNFANYTVSKGRLHCRRMQLFLKQFQQNRPRERNNLSVQVQQDLGWWLKVVEHSSSPIIKPKVTHFFTTDAADAGWGAQLNNKYLSGKWATYQKPWHSNMKELYAVFAAIHSQRMTLKEAHILIQSDNRTLVSYIRNEGGTRSLGLLKLTTRLLKLIQSLGITLSANYLPGRINEIADRLSRGRKLPEWHLLPQATEALFKEWGTPDVDLFASKASNVVPRYVTLDSADCTAIFCDAFSRQWDFQLGWAFPPPSLIPRVLAHLNSAKGTYILIAPQWTKCFWLPDVRTRAIGEPLPIKNLRKVLIDLTTGTCPPQVDKLSLLAWKIGGGLSRSPTGQGQNKTY